jgi:general secretion pathway protein E
VNPEIGYTFASALRSILRHDPDVVLLGEMRDSETASIAVQAALTGHLVLSTLHTNSAIGSITRLVDMGVERFLLASSVRGVMAQRLIRRLCDHCKRPAEDSEISAAMRARIERLMSHVSTETASGSQPKYYQPQGCEHCMHSGYRGRLAVYELIDLDDTAKAMIQNSAPESEMTAFARAHGSRSLLDDALLKVAQGSTSVEEAMSVA